MVLKTHVTGLKEAVLVSFFLSYVLLTLLGHADTVYTANAHPSDANLFLSCSQVNSCIF